jgi:hypothetical protein
MQRLVSAVLIVGFTLGAGWAGFAAEVGKAQELRRALEEIGAAEQTMRQKASLAEDACRRLKLQAEEFSAEIREERRRANIASYPQALQVSRIDFNLRLLQRLGGYTDRLEERIRFFRSALHALEFYRRQIRDDMLILRTLSDADTAGLLRQLAADLKGFNAQAKKPMLTAATAGLRPLESIWNEMLSGR